MIKFTYLFVNFAAIIIPFIFTFHPKLQFHRKWKALWPAIGITSLIFISWDIIFTKLEIWSFNPTYLTGYYLINLPIEEWLFFVCIPYACVFTYHCFKTYFQLKKFDSLESKISTFLPLFLLTIGLLNYHRLYTSVTLISLAISIWFLKYIIKTNWLGLFYFSYIILLIPFFLVNGTLTGTGLESAVVNYNNMENLNIRLHTIPIEDIFYGMLLIMTNICLFEFFQRKHFEKTTDISI